MYLEHFGFREQPFGPTPDPRFLYFSAEHAEALAALHYGVTERRGLLALVAPPGMGKTTLLRHLLDRWKDRADTAFVLRPPETRQAMIAAVLDDLGITPTGRYPDDCQLLEERALSCRRRGGRLILVFDEAQGIPDAVLDEIRLLTNFESPQQKLIEVILAGQLTLVERIGSERSEQLRQRVVVWTRITRLPADEVPRYVEHRLKIAGTGRRRLFSRAALDLVARASQGIPREINTLCFNALVSAFVAGKKRVEASHVQQAIAARSIPDAEERFRPALGRRWLRTAATLVLAAGALVAGLYFETARALPVHAWQALQTSGGTRR